MSSLFDEIAKEKYHAECRNRKPMNDAQPADSNLRISGPNARIIIQNCHSMMRNKFKGSHLWSMVGHITGHGSGYSMEICKSANLDPMQPCGVKHLKDYKL